jgi:autotransporter passenger strand-loop-strand repeat protein
VLSGGVSVDPVVSAYDGEDVYGTAIGTTLGYAASQIVFAGGTALAAVIDGSEIVSAGGVTTGAMIVQGEEFVASGGVARATVVAYSSGGIFGDGQIVVASGGTMVRSSTARATPHCPLAPSRSAPASVAGSSCSGAGRRSTPPSAAAGSRP